MDTKQEEIRNSIINLFEIDKLPENEKEPRISEIGRIIFESVLLRVLPTMKNEDLKEYEKLIEGDTSPSALMDFLNEKVPNFYEIITEEAEKTKSEMQK